MSALRLEVETHIVTASATAVQNLTKCVAAAGVKIDELVVNSLASAEAVLTETEKELGVAVADIGAGTIDLALFQDGSPFHTRVLPVGGNNVTNDVAIGLKTSLQVAEELKVRHGTCDLRSIGEDEEISVSVLGEDAGRTVSRLEVCQIIEARMRETFELLRNEIRAAGVGHAAGRDHPDRRRRRSWPAPPSSAARSSRCRSGSPRPAGIGGLVDTLLTPSYATAVGLLQWGAASLAAGEPTRYESAPAGGGLGPAPRRDPEHLPVDDPRARRSGPGVGRGLTRPDGRRAPRFAAEASAGGDGLLSIFVPARDGRARRRRARRRLGRRPAGRARPAAAARRALYRHRHGSPATAPTTSCRCSRRRR